MEELGIATEMRHAYSFIYRADVGNGLVEHEYDHVLIGLSDGPFNPDPEEVAGWRFMNRTDLKEDMTLNPHLYCAWLPHIIRHLDEHIPNWPVNLP